MVDNKELESLIKNNIGKIRHNIEEACKKANRNAEEVTLLAVSKTKPIEYIYSAMKCNQNCFGENKVQEIMDKYENIPNVDWHMIGHLQTNKVKYIVDKVSLIHSVDSIKLANVINKEAAKRGIVSDILIEVNVAKEESKFGIDIEECENFIKEVSTMENIRVRGLMTIAPFVDDPEKNRVHFRKLKEVFVDINKKTIHNDNMDILSMGMTNDYEVAIEEGSTLVRVGTGIFGER